MAVWALVVAAILGVVTCVHGGAFVSCPLICCLLLDLILIYGVLSVGSFVNYRWAPGKTPRVAWRPPGVSLWQLVMNPVEFWEKLRAMAKAEGSGGAAIFQLLGARGVLCVERSMMRAATKDTVHFEHYAHPNARWLFYTTSANQLIVMPEDLHSVVRNQYNTFLSTSALLAGPIDRVWGAMTTYLESTLGQKESVEVDVRVWSQALLAHAILTNFYPGFAKGEGLPDGVSVWDVCADIQTFTMGFLSLPIPFRPFGLGKAIAAGERVISILTTWMRNIRDEKHGDFKEEEFDHGFLGQWMQEIVRNPKTKTTLSDRDVAINILDMVFASQDATNSAVCFAVGYLATHPEASKRLYEALKEEKGASAAAENTVLNYFVLNLLAKMPPVPMTLRRAIKECVLKGKVDGPPVHILKGDIVVQSIESLSEVHDTLDVPLEDMFREPEDPNFSQNHVFGTGRHKCPGKYYAIVAVKVFVAIIVKNFDITPADYDPTLIYFPTLFPAKSGFRLTKKEAASH